MALARRGRQAADLSNGAEGHVGAHQGPSRRRSSSLPPPARPIRPAHRSPARVDAGRRASSSAPASIPADRWRTVLVAGDNSSPAFDNGIDTMREQLGGDGRAQHQRATRPRRRGRRARLASATNVVNARCAAASGEACLVYHHQPWRRERLLPARPTDGCVAGRARQRAERGCGTRPTVLIVSACHSGIFINARDAPAQPHHPRRRRHRPRELRLRRRRRVHLLRPVPAAAARRAPRRGPASRTATRACVENLERRMGVQPPSRPQLFVGAAVDRPQASGPRALARSCP